MTLAAAGGCSRSSDRRNTAEILLEQKYGEEFSVIKYDGQEMLNDYYSVTAYCNDNPDIVFEAKVNNDAKAVSDNYWAKHLCAGISETIYRNLDAGAHYYVQSTLMIDDIYQTDLNMTLEECAEKKILSGLTVYIFTNETDDLAGFYNSINRGLGQMPELYGSVRVYYTTDDQLKSIQQYLTSNARMDSGFEEIASSLQRGSFAYRNGKLEASENDFADTLR